MNINLDFNHLLQKMLTESTVKGKKSKTKMMKSHKKHYLDKCRERYVNSGRKTRKEAIKKNEGQ